MGVGLAQQVLLPVLQRVVRQRLCRPRVRQAQQGQRAELGAFF